MTFKHQRRAFWEHFYSREIKEAKITSCIFLLGMIIHYLIQFLSIWLEILHGWSSHLSLFGNTSVISLRAIFEAKVTKSDFLEPTFVLLPQRMEWKIYKKNSTSRSDICSNLPKIWYFGFRQTQGSLGGKYNILSYWQW